MTDADYAWFAAHPGIWIWEEDGQILGFSAGGTRDGTIWALYRAAGWTVAGTSKRGELVFTSAL
jgi:hypothetical protein